MPRKHSESTTNSLCGKKSLNMLFMSSKTWKQLLTSVLCRLNLGATEMYVILKH